MPSELRVALMTPLFLHVQASQCCILTRLISQDMGLTAPSQDHQSQKCACKANSPMCLYMLVGTQLWLPSATHWYLTTADMRAVGNPGIATSHLCHEVRFYSGICFTSLSSHVKLHVTRCCHCYVEGPIKICLWNYKNNIVVFFWKLPKESFNFLKEGGENVFFYQSS